MNKYLKHYYVEGENFNKYLINSNVSSSGKTHPPIEGLDVKFWCYDDSNIDYCLSFCPVESEVQITEGIWELTEEEFIQELFVWFNRKKTKRINSIYERYSELVDKLSSEYSRYSITEQILFKTKYDQSLIVLNSEDDNENFSTTAILLHEESTQRNMNIKQLAESIKNAYEEYSISQNTLIIKRGIEIDEVNSILFDNSTLQTALETVDRI